jgi:tetratricopeptide (TPR) repeat protein
MANATVVAKGTLTQYQGVNYLLMKEYQIETNPPAKKSARDEKTKAAAPGIEKPAPSPVEALVKEGVAARYERKDTAAAERAWERALPLLDQPGVAAMDRYQACAGLGLIYGERKEYAKSRDLFKRAVDASREIAENRKPLSYSYYNLACAEALLGEPEAALASLRLALDAERQTDRRRYVKMAAGDERPAPGRKGDGHVPGHPRQSG